MRQTRPASSRESSFAQAFILDHQGVAELPSRQRPSLAQQSKHLLLETVSPIVMLLGDDREMRHRGIRRDEFQRHQRRNGRSAVVVGEREPLRRR